MKREMGLALLCGLLSLPTGASQTYFNSHGGQLNVGWQDENGNEQQITYRLAPAKLPPLVAFRPARMQEVVQYNLVQQAAIEFPEVQFSLSRGDLSLKSRQPEQLNAAIAWIGTERTKLEREWLKQHYLQPFTPPNGGPAIKQDHVRIALESREELAPLADQLRQEGATATEVRQKTVAHMLAFIQNIPYRLLDRSGDLIGKGFLSPRLVLEENRGDCDSKVTLMAALVAQLFPELPQIMVFVPGHALIGIALPAPAGAQTLSWQGERYLLMEPTGPAQFPVGQIAPTSKTLIDSRQVSVQPVQAGE